MDTRWDVCLQDLWQWANIGIPGYKITANGQVDISGYQTSANGHTLEFLVTRHLLMGRRWNFWLQDTRWQSLLHNYANGYTLAFLDTGSLLMDTRWHSWLQNIC